MLPSTAMTHVSLPAAFARGLRIAAACLALSGCGSPATGPVPSPRLVGPSGLVVSPKAVSMSPGDSASVTIGEQGYSGSFSQSNNCSGIVTVTGGGPASYGIAAVAPGLCTITISDTDGHSAPVSVSVQTIVIGGQ